MSIVAEFDDPILSSHGRFSGTELELCVWLNNTDVFLLLLSEHKKRHSVPSSNEIHTIIDENRRFYMMHLLEEKLEKNKILYASQTWDFKDERCENILFYAIQNRAFYAIEEIIQEAPELLKTWDPKYGLPLDYFAYLTFNENFFANLEITERHFRTFRALCQYFITENKAGRVIALEDFVSDEDAKVLWKQVMFGLFMKEGFTSLLLVEAIHAIQANLSHQAQPGEKEVSFRPELDDITDEDIGSEIWGMSPVGICGTCEDNDSEIGDKPLVGICGTCYEPILYQHSQAAEKSVAYVSDLDQAKNAEAKDHLRWG